MDRRVKRFGAALGLVVGLALAPAAAQSEKLEPPDLARYLRWGPLRARPGVELSNLGYDSNILFNQAGDSVGDYTVTISPKLEGLVLFGDRAFLTFRERLDYTAYAKNQELNYFNDRGTARITVPFSRFGVFGDLKLENVHFRPGDRENIRPEQKLRDVGFGAIFLPGWRTEVEVQHHLSNYRYKEDADDPIGGVEERLACDEARSHKLCVAQISDVLDEGSQPEADSEQHDQRFDGDAADFDLPRPDEGVAVPLPDAEAAPDRGCSE